MLDISVMYFPFTEEFMWEQEIWKMELPQWAGCIDLTFDI